MAGFECVESFESGISKIARNPRGLRNRCNCNTTEASPQTDKHVRTVPLSLVYNWSMRGKPTEKMKPETARSVAEVLG
ncbi:MAG TPA: hypothetical protein VK638_35680, partial [Edaphobacter sp.]|nr:hypothetical protein [Edaphobacter sp.]